MAVAPAVWPPRPPWSAPPSHPTYPGNDARVFRGAAAVLLIAVERAWDGHHRQAFALGMVPCLDRPELWLVWGTFGFWLMWRDRRAIPLVLGLGVLMLALWVGPQLLGRRKVQIWSRHAQNNHSPIPAVNSSFPFWNELSITLWPLALQRVEAAALILMVVTTLAGTRPAALGGWEPSLRAIMARPWHVALRAVRVPLVAGRSRSRRRRDSPATRATRSSAGCSSTSVARRLWLGRIGLARGRQPPSWLRRRQATASDPSVRLAWLAAASTLMVLIVFCCARLVHATAAKGECDPLRAALPGAAARTVLPP